MKAITKEQYLEIYDCILNSKKLPLDIQNYIGSLQKSNRDEKVHLLFTCPEGQEEYNIKHVNVDDLSYREIYELNLHAQVRRGCFISI